MSGEDAADDGVNLSDDEARLFVTWLAARHLDGAEWLEWEDVPYLGEHAFERLVIAARALSYHLSKKAHLAAEHYGVDLVDLHRRVTDSGRTGADQ